MRKSTIPYQDTTIQQPRNTPQDMGCANLNSNQPSLKRLCIMAAILLTSHTAMAATISDAFFGLSLVSLISCIIIACNTPKEILEYHESSVQSPTKSNEQESAQTASQDNLPTPSQATPQAPLANTETKSFSRVGAAFISISLVILDLPLTAVAAPIGFLLPLVSCIFLLYIIPKLRRRYAYAPFFCLLALYALHVSILMVSMGSVSGADGESLGWLIVFSLIPFGIVFFIGNLAYHNQSMIFAIALAIFVSGIAIAV